MRKIEPRTSSYTARFQPIVASYCSKLLEPSRAEAAPSRGDSASFYLKEEVTDPTQPPSESTQPKPHFMSHILLAASLLLSMISHPLTKYCSPFSLYPLAPSTYCFPHDPNLGIYSLFGEKRKQLREMMHMESCFS